MAKKGGWGWGVGLGGILYHKCSAAACGSTHRLKQGRSRISRFRVVLFRDSYLCQEGGVGAGGVND